MFVGVTLRQAKDLEAALRLQLGRLLPGDVPLGEAPAMWQAYEAIERLAAAAKTLLAARVDESRAWASEGDRSSAEYLARRSGCSVGVARGGLETSRRLQSLPATEAAVRRGELSQAQAETIADAAAVNPDAERSLLHAARHTNLGELREQASRAKAAADPDPDATHRRLHQQRRLRRFTDAEGAWHVQGRGTPDAGALFNTVLDPIVDEVFLAARRLGRREPREAYAFDALIELARRARAGVAPAATPDGTRAERAASVGDGTAAPRPGRPARRNPSYLALLRVDVESLVRGRVEGDELCEIAGIGPIPPRVARDLLNDAILELVITRGVDVANVTHLGRGPSAAQRIALLWTSPACTNVRCSHSLAIQHDHRRPWAEVHETVLDNLDRLCPACHRRKTHEGWALVEGRGRRRFVPPDDPRHPGNGPPVALAVSDAGTETSTAGRSGHPVAGGYAWSECS
jgi:hypothetical protein